MWLKLNLYVFCVRFSDLNKTAAGKGDAGYGLFTTKVVNPGMLISYWGYMILDSEVDQLPQQERERALDTGMFLASKNPEGIIVVGSLGCMATYVFLCLCVKKGGQWILNSFALNRYVNHHPDPAMWNCRYVTNEGFFNSETGMLFYLT